MGWGVGGKGSILSKVWNHFKGDVGEISVRLGGVHMPYNIDTILN